LDQPRRQNEEEELEPVLLMIMIMMIRKEEKDPSVCKVWKVAHIEPKIVCLYLVENASKRSVFWPIFSVEIFCIFI
jgi:hypothetical protein